MHFSHESGGRSLADMAQRDLDAALQLLTDRAQYITGSSGAAIALRRSGSNDMLCRASTGSNAPELGTLLSTEFGLSGESVRTRRALRCDDAERDARVNHEVCRAVGIASVVVMPVVHDDEVLGVFELFSGKAHAFGERDLSALRRLSEMVETAVRLARAAEGIPERWNKAEPASGVLDAAHGPAIDRPAIDRSAAHPALTHDATSHSYNDMTDDSILEDPIVEVEAVEVDNVEAKAVEAKSADARSVDPKTIAAETFEAESKIEPVAKAAEAATAETEEVSVAPVAPMPATAPSSASASATDVPVRRPLLWSAAASMSGDATPAAEPDQSHLPAAFRNLRKCEACGFPVSNPRTLCVECEEKKWRGQLKPRPTTVASTSGSAAAAAPAPERKPESHATNLVADPKTTPSVASPAAKDVPSKGKVEAGTSGKNIESKQSGIDDKEANEDGEIRPGVQTSSTTVSAPLPAKDPAKELPAHELKTQPAAAEPAPTLMFSAGLAPSQSWLARNKYVLAAMLAIAGTVAAILLLR